MRFSSLSRKALSALSVITISSLALVGLSGCSGLSHKVKAGQHSVAPSETGDSVKLSSRSFTIPYLNNQIKIGVGPVFRRNDGVPLLYVDAKFAEPMQRKGNGNIGLDVAMSDSGFANAHGWAGIHILSTGKAYAPLTKNIVFTNFITSEGSDYSLMERKPIRILLAFTDFPKDTKQVDVAVPGGGLATGVPVVPLDKAPANLRNAGKRLKAHLDSGSSGELVKYVWTPQARTQNDKKQVEVNLFSDVLFDSGKWDLKPEAKQAIDQAVSQLLTHEPGEVKVVGHTDDVPDSNVGNQKLSENRAASVADALKAVSDLSGYTFSTSGVADTQPAVKGSTDKARAANRRVQIVSQTPMRKKSVETADDAQQLAQPGGEVAKFPDSVRYSKQGAGGEQNLEITASKAIRYPDYTLVKFQVKALTDFPYEIPVKFGEDYQNAGTGTNHQFSLSGVTVLRGNKYIWPLRYPYSYADGSRNITRYLDLSSQTLPLGPNQTGDITSFALLFPPQKGDTLTLDATSFDYHDKPQSGWRITDIPIEDASRGSD